jgi:adenylate cyclase
MTDERATRKMSAILSADVKGYSRLMSMDEEGTVKALNDCREIIARCVHDHRGRVVDSPGDNVLAEFVSTVEAAKCAVKIQEDLKARNADLPESKRMEFRIGVNLGDVIEEEGRIYGDGVNIAARLEGLAEAGGICISGTAFDQVKGKFSLGYQFVGKQTVKNIPDPIRAYKVLTEPENAGKVIGDDKPKKWRWAQIAAAMLIVIAGTFAISNIFFGPPEIEPASVDKMAFPLPDKPSIAVLPFDNMSGDPKEDYLSDGLTEQIITTLASYPRLFVIARQSSFSYKGKPVKVQQVAEELGVQYVLEGSVQKSGDKVRITAQLIDAITGHHIWSERYDRELKEIFALQDEISIEVMNGMSAELTEGEQARRWTKSGVTNLKALEKHYRAQGFFCLHTKENYEKARPLFEEAIALEPKFVWPYVYLGYLHAVSGFRGWSESRAKSIQTAFELAQKAAAIDNSHDGPPSLLSLIYRVKSQDDKALAEAERAVALNPNASDAYMQLAATLGKIGRWEESLLYAKKSLRLSPFPGAAPFSVLGRAYFMTGQYDESIATYKKALKVSPNYFEGHVFIVACYSLMGRDAEATAAVKEVLDRNPKFSIESYAKRLTFSFNNEADIERVLDALRKTGLPEKSTS